MHTRGAFKLIKNNEKCWLFNVKRIKRWYINRILLQFQHQEEIQTDDQKYKLAF